MNADTETRPLLLLPEMLLFVGGLTALMGGSFVPRQRQWLIRAFATVVLLGAMAAAAAELRGPSRRAFEGTFAVDTATGVVGSSPRSGRCSYLSWPPTRSPGPRGRVRPTRCCYSPPPERWSSRGRATCPSSPWDTCSQASPSTG